MATILVVDDERPVREFLAQALEDTGHRVLQAWHGRHALHVITESQAALPDLVISDVMMPLVTGDELCQALRASPQTASIPIILMSAAPHTSVGAEPDAFIAKPFDLDTLDALVARVLANRTPSS